MSIRAFGLVMFFVILAGCNNNPTAKSPAEKETQTKGTKPIDSAKKKKTVTEAEARTVLKTALDSWAFGDSLEKYTKNHPDVKMFDTNWLTKMKIGRYEINNVRIDEGTFEFIVTMIFREDGGEVSRSRIFQVTKVVDRWVISGLSS